jgi:hypothetical protein
LFYINLHTLGHATCPESLHFCFYKHPLLDCALNQIDQFSVITHLSVLIHLLPCLPGGFVLVDISTLFYILLHTPAHGTCPKCFSVLNVTIVILCNTCRLQIIKLLTKIVSVVLLFFS